MQNSNLFKDKLIWLTGASSGIGYAVAEELAQKGASLIITSRTADHMEEKKKNLIQKGAVAVENYSLDISDEEAPLKIKDILKGRALQGLFLNAGGPKSGKLTSLNFQDYMNANKLILAGPAQFLTALIPYMERNSSIVAVTSTSIKEPVRDLNLSAIYRSGFVVFLKNLAHEIGYLGIRVNNVGPGATNTEHLERIMQAQAHKKQISFEEEKNSWTSQCALQRMGQPAEIARVVLFLLSEESSFVNGQSILVDGCSTVSYF